MDKGCRIDTHVVAAYHINENTSEIHRIADAIMTEHRIGVEWGMGKVYVMCFMIRLYRQ
jgi:hypothetical protein